jgi:hypothetical protein
MESPPLSVTEPLQHPKCEMDNLLVSDYNLNGSSGVWTLPLVQSLLAKAENKVTLAVGQSIRDGDKMEPFLYQGASHGEP